MVPLASIPMKDPSMNPLVSVARDESLLMLAAVKGETPPAVKIAAAPEETCRFAAVQFATVPP